MSSQYIYPVVIFTLVSEIFCSVTHHTDVYTLQYCEIDTGYKNDAFHYLYLVRWLFIDVLFTFIYWHSSACSFINMRNNREMNTRRFMGSTIALFWNNVIQLQYIITYVFKSRRNCVKCTSSEVGRNLLTLFFTRQQQISFSQRVTVFINITLKSVNKLKHPELLDFVISANSDVALNNGFEKKISEVHNFGEPLPHTQNIHNQQ